MLKFSVTLTSHWASMFIILTLKTLNLNQSQCWCRPLCTTLLFFTYVLIQIVTFLWWTCNCILRLGLKVTLNVCCKFLLTEKKIILIEKILILFCYHQYRKLISNYNSDQLFRFVWNANLSRSQAPTHPQFWLFEIAVARKRIN